MGFSAASTNNQSFWAGIENITSTSATLYTYVTAGYITLLFKNIPPPASGKVREYVVEVDGHYIVQNRFASAQNRIRTNQNLANSSKNVLQNKLINNYPNPFNPTTKISFEIGNSSNVTLKIFNVLGKEVATLVNDLKNSGHYEVMFDGSNFVSGIYFYKIAGNFHQIKQMVLIK
ncbi:MAG: T9SS type A sorting domain-containing protein [Bacteroidetes bacterium]|nr:T9SS type A sorting domain-containing protein [Bacteroidota bacterium]